MPPLPKTTPEQRSSLYEDVEDLISMGFLSHSVSVAGSRLSLRALASGDLFLLRTHGEDEDWQTWLIASSVWMVDGFNLLGEPNSAYHIYKMLKKVSPVVLDVLFSIVKGLFLRQDNAVGATEAYCYENASRFRWKASSRSSIGGNSGIPGSERFGLNPVTQMWSFFNAIEDKRDHDETQWGGFKLAASATSPKGVQKIDKQDKTRKEQEENRRQDVLDRFYYIRRGVISAESKPTDSNSIAIRAKSVDDLEGEMQRWVSGDEDFHDKVVTKYKTDITHRYDTERDDREDRRQLLQQKYEEMEMDTRPQPLVGYTLDQLKGVVKDRRPGVAQIENDFKGTQEKMYHRHLHHADKGLLKADGDRLEAPPADMNLMDLISDRKVPFKTED